MADHADLYADSAQARALDRRLSDDEQVHWAAHVSPAEAAEDNRAWLENLRARDEQQKASSRRAIAAALGKMEALCGSGAARRIT